MTPNLLNTEHESSSFEKIPTGLAHLSIHHFAEGRLAYTVATDLLEHGGVHRL